MQKLDFRNNLEYLVKLLKSEEIVKYLDGAVNKNELLKLLVESKSGFDQASTDRQKAKILTEFKASEEYSTQKFSSIVTHVSTRPDNNNRLQFLNDNNLNNFYAFHKMLMSTFRLVDNLLFENKELFENNVFNAEKATQKGNLVIQIVDNEKVRIHKFNEISEALENLIETVYTLYDKIEGEQFEEQPSIVLLDSGSDINFVIKLPEKASNLIAQVIKQFWDLIVNNKYVRHKQKMTSLIQSITVLEKIEQAKNNETIDRETAEILKKGIVENTEKIVFGNAMTKQLLQESNEYSNRQLLLDKSNQYLLEEAKQEDDKA